jgi:hypothetical protein
MGQILGVEHEFAPLERLEDTAEGDWVVAQGEKRQSGYLMGRLRSRNRAFL